MPTTSLAALLAIATAWLSFSPAVSSNLVAEDMTHGFIAFGQQTYQVDGQGQRIWTYPHSTRDGYVLENGKILLTLSKSRQYAGGAVVEIGTDGSERVLWLGQQAEVNSAQPTATGTYVITEAGANPRLLEIDSGGKIVVEFPLRCQTPNYHMQTRMARKLSDGTYLAPHLLDFAVVHYDVQGRVLGKLDTTAPNDSQHKIHSWPFTAIRHANGHTLVTCTNGNRVVDFDRQGIVVWQLTNDDLPGPWLQDPCGAQVLPNGNIAITSYGAGAVDLNAPKLIEVDREKQVVWTYTDRQQAGIHHFQILDTNGKKVDGPALK